MPSSVHDTMAAEIKTLRNAAVEATERAERAEAERDRLRLELTQSRNDLDIARTIAREGGEHRARVAELEAAIRGEIRLVESPVIMHTSVDRPISKEAREWFAGRLRSCLVHARPLDSVGTNQTSAAGQKPTDEHNRKERDDMRAAGEKPDSVEANASRGAGQRHSDRAESRPDDQFHPQFTGTCALADGAVKSAPYSPNDLRPSDAPSKSYALTCDGCGCISPVVSDEDDVTDAAVDAGWTVDGHNDDDRDACSDTATGKP